MNSNLSPPTQIPAAKSGLADTFHFASEETSYPLFHTLLAVKVIISHNPNSNRAIHVSRLHPSIQKPVNDVLKTFSSDEQCWITQLHTLDEIDATGRDDARIRICLEGYELANEVYQLCGKLESLTKTMCEADMKGVTIECWYIPPFYVADKKLEGGLKERYLMGVDFYEFSVDIANVRIAMGETPAQIRSNEEKVALVEKVKADEIIKVAEETAINAALHWDWFKPIPVKRIEQPRSSTETCKQVSTSTQRSPIAKSPGHARGVSSEYDPTSGLKVRMARAEVPKPVHEKNKTDKKEPKSITFQVEKELQVCHQKRMEDAQKEVEKKRQEGEERKQMGKMKKSVLRSSSQACDIDVNTKSKPTPISAALTRVMPGSNIMDAKHPESWTKVKKRVHDIELATAKDEPKSRPSSRILWQIPSSFPSKLSAIKPLKLKASAAANSLKLKASPPQVSKVKIEASDKAGAASIKIHLKEQSKELRESLHTSQTYKSPSSPATSKEYPTVKKRYSAGIRVQIEPVTERDHINLARRQCVTALPQSCMLDAGKETPTVSMPERYIGPSYQTASFAVEQLEIHKPKERVGSLPLSPQHKQDNPFPPQTRQEQSVKDEDWDLVEYSEKSDSMIHGPPKTTTEEKVAADDEFEMVNHPYRDDYKPQELKFEEFEGYPSGALDPTDSEGDAFDREVKLSLKKSVGDTKRFWLF